jgi:hypothetical protein
MPTIPFELPMNTDKNADNTRHFEGQLSKLPWTIWKKTFHGGVASGIFSEVLEKGVSSANLPKSLLSEIKP